LDFSALSLLSNFLEKEKAFLTRFFALFDRVMVISFRENFSLGLDEELAYEPRAKNGLERGDWFWFFRP